MIRTFLLSASVLCMCFMIAEQFTIPLPFGSIDVSKDKDGKVNVNTNSNVDILGFGGHSGLNLTAGNGTLTAKPSMGVLVNGSDFGANSTLGFDKEKGVAADTDVQAGNNTLHGGLGKESQFINDLADAVDNDSD